jgi:predicted dehydrogenase
MLMKAAVIGLGPQGKRIVSALKGVSDVELVAVADGRAEALGWPELPGTVFRAQDAAALWDGRGIDLVCIATNAPSHAALAVAAMEAGARRVMVEKPMACSVSECRRMVEVAKSTGSRLAVNQSRRHDPFYRWLRSEVRSKRLGELRSIWIQRPGIGLGCLGTHYFDLVRFLSDREVGSVSAWVDDFIGPNPRGAQFIDPGGMVVLDLGERVRGVIAQIEDGAGPMSVEINLTLGRIRIDERYDRVEIFERDPSVVPGPDRPAAYVEKKAPAGLSAKTNVVEMTRGVLTELAGKGSMECDAIHGSATLEILAAAYASDARGHVPVAVANLSEEECAKWLPIT